MELNLKIAPIFLNVRNRAFACIKVLIYDTKSTDFTEMALQNFYFRNPSRPLMS